ncbi:MAG TPA: flagellar export chaperone FliS [Acidobacteriota bacterium]|nr:flagellar export chaperone FliS [Acidobacteriota bacterium]
MQHSNSYSPQSQVQSHYQRMQITTADPFELMLILYRGAVQRLQSAAKHMKEGRIEQRVADLNKAQDMILELKVTLDFEKGGDIAKQLDRLYSYMLSRLVEANARQEVEGLLEVVRLLKTLISGWEGARENLKNGQGGEVSPGQGAEPEQSGSPPSSRQRQEDGEAAPQRLEMSA